MSRILFAREEENRRRIKVEEEFSYEAGGNDKPTVIRKIKTSESQRDIFEPGISPWS